MSYFKFIFDSRNEVWKSDVRGHGNGLQRFATLMTRGMKVGAVLFVATIAVEYVLDPYSKRTGP